MSLPEPPEGLRDLIRRIAAAADSGSRDELNEALIGFARLAEPVLRPVIRVQLRIKRVGGPSGMIDEVEDILNELLDKLLRVATCCTAITDSQATGWLITVVKNHIEDQAKTPRRRLANLIKRPRDPDASFGPYE